MHDKNQSTVTIYIDGACSGNPGPGGWGALLMWKSQRKELSGGDPKTTNNRMEMTAAIKALESLKKPVTIKIYSDSQYLVKGITEWLPNWKRRGWLKADKKPVENRDLWEQLDELKDNHKIEWRWVKGHAGNELNELVDQLAVAAIPTG